jgi:hypothetical protein
VSRICSCSRLDRMIDMEHALVKLAQAIDWGFLEQTFGRTTPKSRASRRCPTRLIGGTSDPQTHLRPTYPTRLCVIACKEFRINLGFLGGRGADY